MKGKLAFAAAVAAVAAGAAAGATSPRLAYEHALAAARAQQSVHYVSSGRTGSRSVRIAADAARDRGVQRITVASSGKTGHATVIVVADTAYMRADAFTLHTYMGFPQAQAASHAGKWMRIPHSSGAFTAVAAAVRLQSAVSELAMPGPYTDGGTRTIDGRRAFGVATSWTSHGVRLKGTLYTRASGAPLPVLELIRAPASTQTVALSRWNEPVHVSAPAHTVPLP